MYLIPIRIAVRYFPERKGLVTGIIFGALGSSSIIISFMVLSILNPNNISPTVYSDYQYYPDSITSQIPLSFRVISLYFAILSLAALFMKNKKEFKKVQGIKSM